MWIFTYLLLIIVVSTCEIKHLSPNVSKHFLELKQPSFLVIIHIWKLYVGVSNIYGYGYKPHFDR